MVPPWFSPLFTMDSGNEVQRNEKFVCFREAMTLAMSITLAYTGILDGTTGVKNDLQTENKSL